MESKRNCVVRTVRAMRAVRTVRSIHYLWPHFHRAVITIVTVSIIVTNAITIVVVFCAGSTYLCSLFKSYITRDEENLRRTKKIIISLIDKIK